MWPDDPENYKAESHANHVVAIRAWWRLEAHAAATGDAALLRQAENMGRELFDSLLDALRRSFAKLADAYLHDSSLMEDGIQDLSLALYQRLRDLSDSASAAGWERGRNFWTCLKRLASNLFLRHVQKDYGRDLIPAGEAKGALRKAREMRQTERASADGEAPEVADPDGETDLERLLTRDALKRLLDVIRSPRHRQAFLWDAGGVPHEEIARRLGLSSLKSVYNYVKRAKEEMLAWANAHPEEFADWLNGSGGGVSGSEPGR